MAIVRLAEEKDISAILGLYRQLDLPGYPSSSMADAPSEAHRLAFSKICSTPGHELLVAEENGEVVGTLTLLIIPSLVREAVSWAEIEFMVVDEKHRRTGIGRLLLDYGIQRAREAGCYKIQLSSNKKRRNSHKFYYALGFASIAHGFRLYF